MTYAIQLSKICGNKRYDITAHSGGGIGGTVGGGIDVAWGNHKGKAYNGRGGYMRDGMRRKHIEPSESVGKNAGSHKPVFDEDMAARVTSTVPKYSYLSGGKVEFRYVSRPRRDGYLFLSGIGGLKQVASAWDLLYKSGFRFVFDFVSVWVHAERFCPLFRA